MNEPVIFMDSTKVSLDLIRLEDFLKTNVHELQRPL